MKENEIFIIILNKQRSISTIIFNEHELVGGYLTLIFKVSVKFKLFYNNNYESNFNFILKRAQKKMIKIQVDTVKRNKMLRLLPSVCLHNQLNVVSQETSCMIVVSETKKNI